MIKKDFFKNKIIERINKNINKNFSEMILNDLNLNKLTAKQLSAISFLTLFTEFQDISGETNEVKND